MTRTIKKRGYGKPTHQEEQEIWRKKKFVVGIFKDMTMLAQIGDPFPNYETARLAVEYLENMGIEKKLSDRYYISCDFNTLKPDNLPIISAPVISRQTIEKVGAKYGKENRYAN